MSVLCVGAKLSVRTTKMMQLLEQLRTQVHSRKYKNVDILYLSQEVGQLGRWALEGWVVYSTCVYACSCAD